MTASVLPSLQIVEVISNDACFVTGLDYIVKIKFRYASKRSWEISLNGTKIVDLNEILYKDELNATLIIKSHLYASNVGYGDTNLTINVFNTNDREIIEKVICSRLLTRQVSVSTAKGSSPFQNVSFFVKSIEISGRKVISFNFGDGSHFNRTSFLSSEEIRKSYSNIGLYTYSWIFVGVVYIAEGSGEIQVLNPLLQPSVYIFPQEIVQYWPQQRVAFNISQKCGYTAPTLVTFRISFGDGEILPWTQGPALSCNKTEELALHQYKPGCYDTHFEMRNLLGRSELFGKVAILKEIHFLNISAHTISTSTPTVKYRDGIKEFHVQAAHPFRITALTTDGGCRTFEWKILDPYWSNSTYEVNYVVIDLLINKTGSYDIEVNVSNKIHSVTERIKIVVSKSVSGLLLLSTESDSDGLVAIYILVTDPGTSTFFNWTYGDGNFETEYNPNVRPALELANITTASGLSNQYLRDFLGRMKTYKYNNHGVYNITVTATDLFRSISAKRSVLVSKKICQRPTVRILVKNAAKGLVFSIGEAFTILTYVEIDCDYSDQALFAWELFISSERDMEKQRSSESDKMIRYNDINVNLF